MADETMGGIYEIVNLVNGKRYIGSAVHIARRWRQHRCELDKGRHTPILQRAWSKHGSGAFEFRIIELVPDKLMLLAREQHYLDTVRPEYNVARVAGSNLGMKWSEETLARMAAANKRVWECPVHRQKMVDAHKGQKPTAEQLAKISAALLGRKLSPAHAAAIAASNAARNKSPEHRALMSAFWKGKPKTREQIDKMAAAKRGRAAHNKGVPASAEQKSKQSALMKSKYESDPDFRRKIAETTRNAMARPDVKAKVVVANLGRKHSDETRRKMTEAQKLRWELRRATAS